MNSPRVAVLAGLAGCLLSTPPARAVPPLPDSAASACLRSWESEEIPGKEPAWAAGLSEFGAQQLAPAYADFLECLYLSGRPANALTTPKGFRSEVSRVPSDADMLLRFYRSCSSSREGDEGLCKGLLERDVGDSLSEDADWDDVCRYWCDAFRNPQPNTCVDAIKRFGSSGIEDPEKMASACSQALALVPDACHGMSGAMVGRCREMTDTVMALRAGDVRQCPAGSWRCVSVVEADAAFCRRTFFPALAAPACLGTAPQGPLGSP